jgi:hypothetical protein
MLDQGVIKTQFVLQRDEFAKAKKLTIRNLPARFRWLAWLQGGLLFSLMLTGVFYQPNGKLQPISLIVFLLAWLVFFSGSVSHRVLESLQFQRMNGTELWYEFDQSGFRSGMPNSQSHINWPGITTRLETDKLFVLIQSDVLFYTHPKRAFAPEEAASLSQLLAAKIPGRKT